MDRWYYIGTGEAERGVKVAILDALDNKELDRVIIVEDPKKADDPSAVAGLTTVLVRNLRDSTKERRFYAEGRNLWFEFFPNEMTEDLCRVTKGPECRFGFIGQI